MCQRKRERERAPSRRDIDSSKSTVRAQMGAWTGGLASIARYQITSRYVVQRGERGDFISSLRSPSLSSPPPPPCNRCKFHYWPTDSAALNAATRVYRLLSAFIRSSKRCLSPSSVAWLFLRTERKGYSRCCAKEKE